MNDDSYPALFRCADAASNKYQREYLWLIRAEYGLLFVASILSMSVFNGSFVYTAFALVLVGALVVLVLRSSWKPEQHWYGCRAMAESVKTLTWRYMMRAHPFTGLYGVNAKQELVRQLKDLLRKNQAIAEKIDHSCAAEEHLTQEMERLHALPLDERKRAYLQDRVQDQRKWYQAKANFNRRAARKWVAIGGAAYVAGVGMAVFRIQYPDLQAWPIEPVLVLAASVIGWMQIKKFNELAAAYTVTATEIGFIKPKIAEAHTEEDLSDAVNEAELAFSREHTLWIARQTQ